MKFDDYSKKALATAIYKDSYTQLVCSSLGLAGESGEVAEKIKKIIRDKGGEWDYDDRTEIAKELGDVLWYVNAVADYFGIELKEVAMLNIGKLRDRQERNKIKGSGDNR